MYKIIICVLGGMLMVYYFYVNLKIKWKTFFVEFLKINFLILLCLLRNEKGKRIQYFTMNIINSSAQVFKYGIYLQVNYN